MVRIVLSVIAGFFAWVIAWVAIEKILSAILPVWYGAPQAAFQHAVENGGEFTAETRMLLSHIVIGSVVSILAGYVAAAAAGDNARAPLYVGIALLALGLLKAGMSWPYVPLWYHVLFTAILLPMAIVGGKLYSAK